MKEKIKKKDEEVKELVDENKRLKEIENELSQKLKKYEMIIDDLIEESFYPDKKSQTKIKKTLLELP